MHRTLPGPWRRRQALRREHAGLFARQGTAVLSWGVPTSRRGRRELGGTHVNRVYLLIEAST